MPESLKKFLEGLGDKEAEAVWCWLDGTPHVAGDLIEVIGDSHTDLVKKLCGVSVQKVEVKEN